MRMFLTCSLAALLFLASTPVLAAILIVQVRSNYVSGVDVTRARVEMHRTPAPPGDSDARRDRDRGSIRLTSGSDLLTGVRIAELDLVGFIRDGLIVRDVFTYEGEVTLEDATGRVVASRPLRVRWRVDQSRVVVTVLMTKPIGDAQKTSMLLQDRDFDGMISINDVVRYHVTLTGEGSGTFVDRPSEGGSLIYGSVSASAGVVVEGNGLGDTSVHIASIPFDVVGVATVEFDVMVEPVLVNQGELQLEFFGNIGDYATDDPTTPAPGDATVSPIAPGAACCAELADLLIKVADLDADGVPAALDDCPKTPLGVAVDSNGCSLTEFCRAAGGDGQDAPADLCEASDFLNDEPLLSRPGDCVFDVVSKTCLPVIEENDPIPQP